MTLLRNVCPTASLCACGAGSSSPVSAPLVGCRLRKCLPIWGFCVALLVFAGCGRSQPVAEQPDAAEMGADAADPGAAEATPDAVLPAEDDTPNVAMQPDAGETPSPGADRVSSLDPAEPSAGDPEEPAAGLTPAADPGAEASKSDTSTADPLDALEIQPFAEKSPFEIRAEQAFAAPENAKQLTPQGRMWVDAKKKRLILDGYVTLTEGPLEMFACPVGTKEHEAIVAVLAEARHVHAGLLAIGAVQGTPVEFVPKYRPATGQRIAIWVMWNDSDGQPQAAPAQRWIQQTGTDKQLQEDWVFAGSGFWTDPETGREFYEADSGDLVCVSNFSTATLDLPVESTQSNSALVYSAFQDRIPERGTPVRLVFVPIPVPEQELAEGQADPSEPPEKELLEPAEKQG